MNFQARKLHLIEDLLQQQDDKILRKVEKLLNSFKTKRLVSDLSPMSLEEFYARNNQSKKEITEGKLISQKDVKNHFEKRK